MPNQNIDLTSYDPEAARIQRQQRLAQMLQEQSQQDIPINAYNGIQAPISPFSVLAKALQAYGARKNADQADTQYGDLQTKRRKDFADMLSKQYQVPGSSGTVTNQPNTQTDVSGIQAPTISGVTEDRPTTPQEQMANSLSMMSSGNPQAAQMAPELYQAAQQKQQAAQLLSGLDLTNVPKPMVPIIRSQIEAGDIPGATKTYEAAIAPKTVGGNLLTPTATDYDTTYAAKPAAVQEFEYAQQHGFKGSLTDYQRTKANATHVTVTGGAPANPDTIANWAKNVHSGLATIQQVPMAIRSDVSNFLGGEVDTKDSPLVAARMTNAASRLTAPYTKLAQYQLAADAQPYIQRMAAAAKHPGSIGDADLLDSLIKLNTGGNAITEAQASLVTGGRSFSDSVNVMANKLKSGGVLSDSQRHDILSMGKEIASNYQKGLKPVYERATKQLKDANIPERYWTIPDINSFAELSGFGAGANGSGGSQKAPPPPPPGFVVHP